jgi:hypothetical protein
MGENTQVRARGCAFRLKKKAQHCAVNSHRDGYNLIEDFIVQQEVL